MTPDLNRRELLGTAGAGVAATLAGCGFFVDGRGVPGTEGNDYDGGQDNGGGSEIPEGVPEAVHTWLVDNGARLYADEPAAMDATGQDSATVQVGAGQGFAFGPAALIVSPGTEVTWEWTGAGGAHNVVTDINSDSVPVDIELSSGSAESGSDITYSMTLEEPGVAPYVCSPHRAAGMMGAVIVQESGSGMDSESDS